MHTANLKDDMVLWRRDFHAHPELAYEEHRTSDKVAGLLKDWGIEVHRGLGGTGVVGVLRNGAGRRSVGLRADMDALAMPETADRAWASRTNSNNCSRPGIARPPLPCWCNASRNSETDTVATPILRTTIPAARFARRAASAMSSPAARPAPSIAMTVSPAPVTSNTSRASAGK